MGRRTLNWGAGALLVMVCVALVSGTDGCVTHGPAGASSSPPAADATARAPDEAAASLSDAALGVEEVDAARPAPWEPPAEPLPGGLAGAAALLAAGEPGRALEHIDWLLAGEASELAVAPEPLADPASREGSQAWFVAHAIAGRAQLAAGRPDRAVGELALVVDHPKLAAHLPRDAVVFELARARREWAGQLAAGGRHADADEQLRAAARELAAAGKSKPNRLRHAMRIEQARALAAVHGGDLPAARRRAAQKATKALAAVLLEYPNHPDVGLLRLELARARIRGGDAESAEQELRRLHIERAGEAESALAWAELDHLHRERHGGPPRPLAASERLEQAAFARVLRNLELSRRIVDEMADDESLASRVRREAARSRAWTASKQRDFAACAADLRAVFARTPSLDHRDELARCLERDGAYDEAIELWTAAAETKSRGLAANALWRAIELAVRAGEYERARELLDRFEKKHKAHGTERRWLHAWLAYRVGADDEAIDAFAEVERRDDERRTAARYYRGKLLLTATAQEQRHEGQGILLTLVDEADRGLVARGAQGGWSIYYGLMARQRLIDAGEPVPPPPTLAVAEVEHLGHTATGELLAEMDEGFGVALPALRRARQFHSIGWIEEARRELRVADAEFLNSRKRRDGLDVSTPRTEAYEVGLGWRSEWSQRDLYLGAEGRKVLRDPVRAAALERGLARLSLALDEPNFAARLGAGAELPYRTRWMTRPYRRAIEREAAVRDLDPNHLWALMYTESRFRRHVVSHVGARGALQIMPWTARQLQERLGEGEGRLDPDTLYDIDTNAHLAAFYVGELMAKFHGQAPMVYASYNGGPSNVARWLAAKSRGTLGLDDFIEEIPFEETHRYTRRVMEVQATYALMYEGALPRWSNSIDPRFEDNIDF